jgi:hypothetical protein
MWAQSLCLLVVFSSHMFSSKAQILASRKARSLPSNYCRYDYDCDDHNSCINSTCTLCRKQRTICESTDSCCGETTCQFIPSFYLKTKFRVKSKLNHTNIGICRPLGTSCSTESDCSRGLFCLRRAQRCGLCRYNGESCNNDMECCSNVCNKGYCSTEPLKKRLKEGSFEHKKWTIFRDRVGIPFNPMSG